MRIMTSNIWGDYFDNEVQIREEQLFNVYKKYDPDIIGFQEVTSGWYESSLFTRLSENYKLIGTELFDKCNFVPIAVKKSFRLIAKGFEYFENTPDESKAITWAVMDDGQNRFAVCNTHFWWMRGSESEADRKLLEPVIGQMIYWNQDKHDDLRAQNAAQLTQLMKFLQEKYACPVFAFGDMNSTITESVFDVYKANGIQKLFEVAKQRDRICTTHGNPVRGSDGVFHGVKSTDAYINSFRQVLGLPERKDQEGYYTSIDHMIGLGEGFKVMQYRVVEDQEALDATDHSPVYADIFLTSSEYAQVKKNTVDAQNQLKEDEFVRFFNADERGPRIMFVGNSITLHGVRPEIGWYNECGMAASSADKDYVHLLMTETKKRYKNAAFCICQVAAWERQYKDGENLHYLFKNAQEFDADIIIMRFIENCSQEDFDEEIFKKEAITLLQYLNNSNSAKIILTTSFWHHPGDVAIADLAERYNFPIVSLGDLGEKDEMKAIGLFKHEGVAIHPGDLGMKNIADRIWSELEKILTTKD